MVDRIAGSFHPGALGEDLSAMTKFRFSTHGETNPTKRMKRTISALPQDIAPQTDTYEQFTASTSSKVNKIEVKSPPCKFLCFIEPWKQNHYRKTPFSILQTRFALLQEINEINGRLIETVVEICEKVTSGTIIACSYSPVALSATFKAHYMSGKIVSLLKLFNLLFSHLFAQLFMSLMF